MASGVGYRAALLAACGVRVTALEEDQHLLDLARPALERFAPSVSLVSGPLAAGWPTGAPYDMILLEGSVAEIPAVLDQQLRADRGRLTTVLSDRPGVGQAVLAEPTGAGLSARPIFDCSTPAISALLPKPGFVF